jgi:hypothetical protein
MVAKIENPKTIFKPPKAKLSKSSQVTLTLIGDVSSVPSESPAERLEWSLYSSQIAQSCENRCEESRTSGKRRVFFLKILFMSVANYLTYSNFNVG